MKKVLVLGGSGMAGHVVSLFLRENGYAVDTLSGHTPFDRNTHLVDVTDSDKFEDFLTDNDYDFIVNCVASLVQQSEEHKDTAVYLNSYLPHLLENRFSDSRTRIIHISTDDVFSFKDQTAYKEDSPYDGQTFYGRTKALGEIINDKDLTFRTSIVGPSMTKDGGGLFNWFWQQTGEVSGFTGTVWGGITTLELAKAIKAALEQPVSGVYHLVPAEGISKFDLLELFADVFARKDIAVKPVEGTVINKKLVNTRKDFKHTVPEYRSMVQDMKVWIGNHSGIYEH